MRGKSEKTCHCERSNAERGHPSSRTQKPGKPVHKKAPIPVLALGLFTLPGWSPREDGLATQNFVCCVPGLMCHMLAMTRFNSSFPFPFPLSPLYHQLTTNHFNVGREPAGVFSGSTRIRSAPKGLNLRASPVIMPKSKSSGLGVSHTTRTARRPRPSVR